MTTQAEVIDVLIADDYDILRNGLMMSLRMFSDIRIVGEAANGDEVIEQCSALHPDVILLDAIMPRTNGVEAAQVIRARYPNIKIIVLTSYDSESLVQDMVKAGVSGYLLKNVSAQELAKAIRAAHRGERVFADEAIQVLVQAAQRPSTAMLKLTQREREVLKLIVSGASNNEIAHALTVSESTAKKHVSSIMAKLGVASRAEAVAFALQNKLDLD